MNQKKIGSFIAQCRKDKKLTQVQLAEKLNITDRAISKWETGKSMPDASVIMELCSILGISVNELFSGKKLTAENYAEKVEENLVVLKKENEAINKSTRVSHIITLMLLLVLNGYNVFIYGVEKAIHMPSFIIMEIIMLVWFGVYICAINKK